MSPSSRNSSGLHMPYRVVRRFRLVEAFRHEIGGRAGREMAAENLDGPDAQRERLRNRIVKATKGRPAELGQCMDYYKFHRWVALDKPGSSPKNKLNRLNRSYCSRCGLVVNDLGGIRRVVGQDKSLVVWRAAEKRTGHITHQQRLAFGAMLAERDGGWECFYCHQLLDSDNDETWTLDHLVPRNRGGSDRIENLRLACYRCNKAKGDRLLSELRGRWWHWH